MQRIYFLPGLVLLLTFPSFVAGQQDVSPTQFASEQSPALTLKVAAREVVVDVQVLDKKGQPLTGLTADDFKIVEEREPQSIRSFEEHRPKPALEVENPKLAPSLPLNTFTNYTPVANQGTPIVILIDAMDTTSTDLQMERRVALINYFKHLPPGQPPIAIFQFDRTLRMIQGFTSDPKVLLAAAESLRDMPNDSLPPSVMAAMGTPDELRERQKAIENAMRMLTRYIAGYPGRKHLVWFTWQMPMSPIPEKIVPVTGSQKGDAQALTDVLTINRVTVSVVDSAGLANPEIFPGPASVGRAMGSAHRLFNLTNMDMVADQAGGKAYYNSNDLTAVITDLINTGSNYYTLVYSTTNTNWNGEYRSIKVLVDRPDVTLRHKQGYYALNLNTAAQGKVSSDEKRRGEAAELASTTGASAAAPSLRKSPGIASGAAPSASPAAPTPQKTGFQQVMELGAAPPTEILLVAHIEPDTNQGREGKDAPLPAENFMKTDWQHKPFRTYTVVLNADAGSILLDKTPDGARHGKIEIAAVLYTQENEQVNSIFRSVAFALNPDQYRRLLATGLLTKMQFAIPVKGNFFLRLGIHDVNGDKIGAFEIPVDQIKPEAAASNKP